MDTLEFSEILIEKIKKRQSGRPYSALKDADFDPNKCFVKFPFRRGHGWIEDAMYGVAGGYMDEDEPAHQCDRGVSNAQPNSYYWDCQLFSYGEFQICRFHADILSENLRPVEMRNERVVEEHQNIERRAWNDLGWEIEQGVKEDFVDAVYRGERLVEWPFNVSDADLTRPSYVDWGDE